MLQAHHAGSFCHHSGQLHTLKGNFIVLAGHMQIIEDMCLLGLLRSRHGGRNVDGLFQGFQGVHIGVIDLIEHLQNRSRHHIAHMAGMTVATVHIVKVMECIVEIAALGIHIHMVYITLGTVKEDRLHIIQGFLQAMTEQSGPVAGDQAVANRIGMVAEVCQNDGIAFPVKAQHIDTLIHIADGMENIGIAHTGIGTDLAVLHTEAADKGYLGRIAHSPTHLGRLQVLQRQQSRICQLPAQIVEVLRQQGVILIVSQQHQILIIGRAGAGAGMGMGSVQKYTIRRKSGDFADMVTVRIGNSFRKTAVVNAQQHDLLIFHRQSQGIDFQFVQYTFGKTGLVVTDDRDAQRRRNIQTAKAGQQFIHRVTSLTAEPCLRSSLHSLPHRTSSWAHGHPGAAG